MTPTEQRGEQARVDEREWDDSDEIFVETLTAPSVEHCFQMVQEQLDAAKTGRGCPDGPLCSRCPASEDDDACTPAERIIAERDTAQAECDRLRELETVARALVEAPSDRAFNRLRDVVTRPTEGDKP